MLNALHTLPTKLAPTSGLVARGKALATFYKNGILNVWHNRRVGKNFRVQYGAKSALDIAQAITENRHLLEIEHGLATSKNRKTHPINFRKVSSQCEAAFSTKTSSGLVTRSEFLTILRTERDLRKIPLFAIIFAVFFECTPLVIWAFPQIAPSTCWSKSYILKLRDNYSNNIARLRKFGSNLNGSESVFRLNSLQLRQLSQTLGLVSESRAFPLFLYPLSILRSRLQKHMIIVRADDIFLKQNETMLETLDPEELKRALMARALPLDGGIRDIRLWLKEFKEPMDAGYFF